MESTNTPKMVALAAKISETVTELQQRLAAQGLPSPSFSEDAPETLPAELAHLQDAVVDATSELHDMLLNPISLLFQSSAISNLVSIDTICRYKIAELVPSGGKISFGDIAKQAGLEEPLVRRLLRHAMTMRIFQEPEPDMVAHTKISKFLRIPYINAWVSVGAREGWPACTKMVDAMQKWPGSEESNETGFSLANNTDKSIYEVLAADQTRAMRFAASMEAMDHFPGFSAEAVTKAYDWASLGKATVVDVGGSRGHVAIELAQSFGDMKLVVQDMAMVVAGAESGVPEPLKGRVQFMAHELFKPQPVQADAYFLRMVFHNWSDKYALRILKAQIPSLRPGVKILIQDACMPEPGVIPQWREQDLRAMDMSMGCFFNARERTLKEWKALLVAADERFVLKQLIEPERSMLALLEIVWDPSGSTKA
ncbi:S-adenosyl-L-methionine-dependent methyltransferase [Apiospora saccharicola]